MIDLIIKLFRIFLSQTKEKTVEQESPITVPNPITEPNKVPDIIVEPIIKNDQMQFSKKGYLDLADYEGFSSKPYLDSGGVKTIGFGLTTSDIPDLLSWSWDKEISLSEGIRLYKVNLKRYIDAVNRLVTVPLKQNEFDALVSFAYNVGYGRGGLETSTLLKRVNSKGSVQSIIEALKRYNKDNGSTIQGLINRRQKESDVFEHGVYANKDGCVNNIVVDSKTHKPSYKKRIKIEDLL